METNSKREYELSIAECGQTTVSRCRIDAVLEDDGFEYQYAMQYIIDDVLDLKLNESMYFQPNRDDKSSKGIILRIK